MILKAPPPLEIIMHIRIRWWVSDWDGAGIKAMHDVVDHEGATYLQSSEAAAQTRKVGKAKQNKIRAEETRTGVDIRIWFSVAPPSFQSPSYCNLQCGRCSAESASFKFIERIRKRSARSWRWRSEMWGVVGRR